MILEVIVMVFLALIGLAGYTWLAVNLTIWVYERRCDRLTDEEIDELERSFRR